MATFIGIYFFNVSIIYENLTGDLHYNADGIYGGNY